MHKKKPFKGLFRLVKSEQKKRGILSIMHKKIKALKGFILGLF